MNIKNYFLLTYSASIYILKKKASYTWIYEFISNPYLLKIYFPSHILYEGRQWEQHYMNNTSSKLILCAHFVCSYKCKRNVKGQQTVILSFLDFWRQMSGHSCLPQILLQFLEKCGETLQAHELVEDFYNWGEGAISDHKKIKHR